MPMARSREALIAALAAEPASARFRPGPLAVLWVGASLAYVTGVTLLIAPLRPGALESLLTTPRFTIEMLTALALFTCATRLAFLLAIPGQPRRLAWIATWAALLAWIALLAWAWVAPPLPPSMLGKRPYCAAEVLLLAGVPLIGGTWLLSRGFVLQPASARLALGLAAGFLAAGMMQISCMYEAEHAFLYHLGPGALVAMAALVIGARAQRVSTEAQASKHERQQSGRSQE
jgi:hypothetical protein